jgi:hypothetical protein
MREVYLWHIWPSRGWPSSKDEEAALVDALASRPVPENTVRDVERGDVTTVLNVLRNGMTLDDLLVVAPGANCACLLGAYRRLDTLRLTATAAFTALLAEPDEHGVAAHAAQASVLMPVPTYKLVAAASISPEAGVEAAGLLRAELAEVLESHLRLEARLHGRDCELDDVERVRLGRVLYDPYSGGVWSHPCFTPPRVGTLMPPRVRDLLGERPE